MPKIAIIGGASLHRLLGFKIVDEYHNDTPYGLPETPLYYGEYAGKNIVFLSRRGDRCVPPHKINFRANIWALKLAGVETIISVVGAGGIRVDMTPGSLVVPDQLIDYTFDRYYTFFDECDAPVEQVDFTYPYSANVRSALLSAAADLNIAVADEATVGVTQGPRLETLAEIKRLERDGCDLVSMTPMPEVSLARELGMSYANLAIVIDRAPGRRYQFLLEPDEIKSLVEGTLSSLHDLLSSAVRAL